VVTADSGYFSEQKVAQAASMGLNASITTGRLKQAWSPRWCESGCPET
jgi:hypothetical protein